jgi:hypothetical protein
MSTPTFLQPQLLMLSIGLLISAMLVSWNAQACGVSGVDGAAFCSLSDHKEESRPRWAVSAGGVFTSTTLRFSGGLRGDETRNAAFGAIAHFPTANTTLQMALGATFGGTLNMPDGRYDFSPGPTALFGASWQVVDRDVFVLLTSALSFSAAKTQSPSNSSSGYEAFDLRLGAEVGTTLFKVIRPYIPARVFGGPVYWHYRDTAVTGTDIYHYQLGAGVVLRLVNRLNLHAEGIPVGELAVWFGAHALVT